MKRTAFIKTCCYAALGIPIGGSILQSCGSIYYATSFIEIDKLTIARSEFIFEKKGMLSQRRFVLIKLDSSGFPICLYQTEDESYVATLLECTHRGCELNVGGGIYTCPCHGSEFTMAGLVIEGPAIENLKTFKTGFDHEHIYIYLS